MTDKRYTHTPKPVYEHEDVTSLWNQAARAHARTRARARAHTHTHTHREREKLQEIGQK